MGKGLSELQKSILKIAYRNGLKGNGASVVRNREILKEYYKFPFHSPLVNTINGSPQIFRRNEIGINRYCSASVAVVKAFNRLVKRGFAYRKHNGGIILNQKGAKVARTLHSIAQHHRRGKYENNEHT